MKKLLSSVLVFLLLFFINSKEHSAQLNDNNLESILLSEESNYIKGTLEIIDSREIKGTKLISTEKNVPTMFELSKDKQIEINRLLEEIVKIYSGDRISKTTNDLLPTLIGNLSEKVTVFEKVKDIKEEPIIYNAYIVKYKTKKDALVKFEHQKMYLIDTETGNILKEEELSVNEQLTSFKNSYPNGIEQKEIMISTYIYMLLLLSLLILVPIFIMVFHNPNGRETNKYFEAKYISK